ncbi:MAG: exodeoxyribonuclease VII small subunit, partial [Acetobacteraceae bacterium]
YERGDSLRRHCAAKLAEAEATVSRIVEQSGGAAGTAPLDDA